MADLLPNDRIIIGCLQTLTVYRDHSRLGSRPLEETLTQNPMSVSRVDEQ
jgi:hypothetical protein